MEDENEKPKGVKQAIVVPALDRLQRGRCGDSSYSWRSAWDSVCITRPGFLLINSANNWSLVIH